MSKTLLVLGTHFIDENVISEYRKMKNTPNVDAVLMIDNTNLKIEFENRVENKIFLGTSVKCFFFDSKLHDEMELPYFTYFPKNLFYQNFGDIIWNNGDYKIYYVRKCLPDYDYYWIIEYDVFCNAGNYEGFLKKFNENRADLVINHLREEINGGTWNWAQGLHWIYKNPKVYGALFSVLRLSAHAIDFLYNKRLEQKEIFQNSNEKNKRWTGCEVFVPTELMNGGFLCENLNESQVNFNPNIYLNDERFFLQSDNHLYHPVKSVKAEIAKMQTKYDQLFMLYRKIFISHFVEKVLSIFEGKIKDFTCHIDKKFNFAIFPIPKRGGVVDLEFRYEMRFMEGKIFISLVFGENYEKYFKVLEKCSELNQLQPLRITPTPTGKILSYVSTNLDEVPQAVADMKIMIESTYDILQENIE